MQSVVSTFSSAVISPLPPPPSPPAASRKTFAVAVGLVLLLIVYGSLFPFRWNFATPQAFVWGGPVGLTDLVENVLLFLPLGALLGWDSAARARPWRHALVWLVLAVVLAAALQWLQRFLPRTPALSDVVFNLAGCVLGGGAGALARQRVGHLLAHQPHWAGADRFALVLIALWVVAELHPLVPSLSLSSVWHNLKSLWLTAPWQPRRMALHAGMALLGLSAVAQLARSVGLAHRARRAALLAAALVLAGKFLVVDQSPGAAVVAGIALGWLLWRGLDGRAPGTRWQAMAVAALFTYLLEAVWPWAWRAVPAPMVWVPFASSLSSTLQAAAATRALEGLCFGALVWGLLQGGARLPGAALCAALLALGCEALQRYLPTRTPEVTAVLVALAMGWLVGACRVRRVAGNSAAGTRPAGKFAMKK